VTIDLTPFLPSAMLILGIFIGYALSRKQQDRPIIERKQRAEPEQLINDPYERAMHTEAELEEMSKERIPTLV